MHATLLVLPKGDWCLNFTHHFRGQFGDEQVPILDKHIERLESGSAGDWGLERVRITHDFRGQAGYEQ